MIFPGGKSAAGAAVHPQDVDTVAVYAEHLCAAELIGNRCIVMAVVGVLGMGLLQVGIKRFCPTAEKLKGGVLELVYCMFLIAASMLLLVNGTYSPAIYLNF